MDQRIGIKPLKRALTLAESLWPDIVDANRLYHNG